MINGDHMIDDHVRNLVHFPGKKYLFSTPHNYDITGYTRINNWKEAAAMLSISPATVARDWQFARAWLFRRLRSADALR